MTALDRLRLDRGAEHLHRLGARAVAELLVEVAGKIGGTPAILATLAEYEARLTPAMIRATRAGGRLPVAAPRGTDRSGEGRPMTASSARPAGDTLGDMIEWCPFRSLLGYGLTEAAIMSRRPAAVIAAPDMAPGDPPPALLAELADVLRGGEVVLILARDRAHRDRLKALLLALAGAVPGGRA